MVNVPGWFVMEFPKCSYELVVEQEQRAKICQSFTEILKCDSHGDQTRIAY